MTTEAPLTTNLWKPPLASGVLAVILGAVVLLWPHMSTGIAASVFGVFLAASGITQIITGLIAAPETRGQALLLVSGVTSLVLGVLALSHLSNAVVLLGIAIGVSLLFRGVVTMISGVYDQGAGHAGWTIFFGSVTAVAGVMLMALPFSSIVTLVTVVGLCLVVLGVLEILSSHDIRMSVNRTNADSTVPSPSAQATSGDGRARPAAD